MSEGGGAGDNVIFILVEKMFLGGYKGTGLCMMVEILCSIMGGATFGKNVR